MWQTPQVLGYSSSTGRSAKAKDDISISAATANGFMQDSGYRYKWAHGDLLRRARVRQYSKPD
jgi:hypothetical protein